MSAFLDLALYERMRWSLFTPGDRVLVAVSGGPDSLSLLHILWTEQEIRGLDRIAAAHLDHRLRGDEAAEEAAWVAAWCAERGIACHVGHADVEGLAQKRKVGKQQAARLARYAFLEEVALKIGTTKIATAHTQDDQVETVLMNALRGTGLDGLRGIPAQRGLFVRPMLDVSRADIETYCVANGLEPRRDPSNYSPHSYTRNRIRLELLPQLARDYNHRIYQALLRLSEIAGRDGDYLHHQAEAALAQSTREQTTHNLVLDRSNLAALHPAPLRYVLRAAIGGLRGTSEGVTYEHLEMICGAIATPPSQAFNLTLPSPHCTIRVDEETVTLTLVNVSVLGEVTRLSLPIPGEARLAQMGWIVRAIVEEGRPVRPNSHAQFNAEAILGSTLTVRGWEEGDRIDPLGMGGRHKKVSDIFTDAKVPRAERPRVPIVADAQGIIWVVGHCVSERMKITKSTTRTLTLTAERQTLP